MIYQILYFAAMVVLVLSVLLITLLRKKQPRLSTNIGIYLHRAMSSAIRLLSLLYHDVNLDRHPAIQLPKSC